MIKFFFNFNLVRKFLQKMQANDVNLIEVKNQYGHRDQEIDQLHVLLNHFSVPLLFVTGTHGTGKSSVTRKILQNCSRGNWVWLDCDEFANVRLIYSHILARLFPTTESLDAPMAPSSFEQDSIDRLDQLDQSVRMQDSSVIMTPELGSSSPPNKSFLDATIQSIDETIATNEQLHSTNSCLNHLEFIEQLNWRLDQMLSHPDAESRCLSRFHIVLDNAEHLIRFDTLIGVLTRLTELVDCRATFSIVMISTHSFEYFRRLPGLVIEPYTLYFRPYSQDALTKLVVRLYPNHENRSLYEK